jgi:hypothetical protein
MSQPPSQSPSQALPLTSASAAATSFVEAVLAKAPLRVEAKVSSRDGIPLLCAVEAALGAALTRRTAQELVWLSNAPEPGVHVLQLQAFGADNTLLDEAVHEFAARLE